MKESVLRSRKWLICVCLSTMTINFQFHIACIAFDPSVPASVLSLSRILDTLAKDLAGSGDLRFVQSWSRALQF